MIKQYGYKTEDEAVEVANALLWEHRDKNARPDGGMNTTTRRRKYDNGEYVPFFFIVDDATGATACVCKIVETYSVVFLTADEARKENRIYPYRGVKETTFPFLIAVGTKVFKPTQPLSIDEALTPKGIRLLNEFFGDDTEKLDKEEGDYLTEEQVLQGKFTIDTAFDTIEQDEEAEEEEERFCVQLNLRPYPQVLTKLTGVKISKPTDYAKAISKLLKHPLTKMQEEAVRSSYNFYGEYYLLRYAVYEFYRTEDFSHLKEILSNYKEFGLLKTWEKDCTFFYSVRNIVNREEFSPLTYVLARYLSTGSANLVGWNLPIKEIAEYTGTPLALMIQASKIENIYDF